MYKLSFKTTKGTMSKEYSRKPVNYSDGGALYYRDNDNSEWVDAIPPVLYRARQDCYEKFGKDKFLNRHNATPEEQEEMKRYYNTRAKLYKEEKVNEK